MFVRKKKNKSGSVSVQILRKQKGRNILVKTVGSTKSQSAVDVLVRQAENECRILEKQESLFVSEEDVLIEGYMRALSNAQIRVMGPELIFGKIFDSMGYGAIDEELFRHLVISRLAYPGSKLKTIDYLLRFQGVHFEIDAVYRFLDKMYNTHKQKIEDITFANTKRQLEGQIGFVFYDMTTLYFEASDEDDLRRIGYSKDGKQQQPQILLGLLVAAGGYPIGYQIFEGNVWEGHTLIPVLQAFEKRFSISSPVVVADAGLLSNKNIEELEKANYSYILGARIKNESDGIKNSILGLHLTDGKHAQIDRDPKTRLIIHFSAKRAEKDFHTRERGLRRLEKNLEAGKLTKSHINNRGYNKYLRMTGTVTIEIDKEKFNVDKQWDGLKGYITNSNLSASAVIENYNQLWQIEKAFRISKTDLRVRPIYHRLRKRIESHICIAFTAYAVYKELETMLTKSNAPFSAIRAAQLTHNMYQMNIILPDSKLTKQITLQMDDEQRLLNQIVTKNV